MFLKNRNISSKIKRSKVTDYAALICFDKRTKNFLTIRVFAIIGELDWNIILYESVVSKVK